MFYKAAFYDRKATIHAEAVGYSCATRFAYDGTPIPWELLTEGEKTDTISALRGQKTGFDENAAKGRSYPGDEEELARVNAELAKFSETVAPAE